MSKILALLLSKLFISIGGRLFPVIMIWRPNETSEAGVITFATSQRDINIATRSYIEWLDEEYEKRQKGNTEEDKAAAEATPPVA